MLRFRRIAAAPIAALCIVVACGEDVVTPTPNTVRQFIMAIGSFAGLAGGTYSPNDPPAPSAGPTLTVVGGNSAITGGTAFVELQASEEFDAVIVSVDGAVGYWKLPVAETTVATLLVTFATQVADGSVDSRYRVITASGAVSESVEISTGVMTVGTGEVQVSVSWDAATDVDLHVVEPGGDELFHGNRTSAAGGRLDLVSNTSCALDNTNVENAFWQEAAPRGSYAVRVNLRSPCVPVDARYVVTVRRIGHATAIFTGVLQPADADGSGLGAGRVVTVFEF